MSDKAIEIHFGVGVNDGIGKQVAYKRSDGPVNFAPVGTVDSGWGYNHFAKRSLLLNSLVNGTLVIEVRMKLANLTQDNEDDCCVICMCKKKSHVLVPCGHMCYCEGCAALIQSDHCEDRKKCPICRVMSDHIMKVYH
jgi:hypothetical protein